MTMLTTIPTSATRPLAWRTAVWLARLRRLTNRFFAAVIARHERHAARVALHRLDDRQLQDIAHGPLADRQQARRTGADPRANAAARLALTGRVGFIVGVQPLLRERFARLAKRSYDAKRVNLAV